MLVSVELNVDILGSEKQGWWVAYRGAGMGKGDLKRLEKLLLQDPKNKGKEFDPLELEVAVDRFLDSFFLRDGALTKGSDQVGRRWVFKIQFPTQGTLPLGDVEATDYLLGLPG